jgi:hypothetical protein
VSYASTGMGIVVLGGRTRLAAPMKSWSAPTGMGIIIIGGRARQASQQLSWPAASAFGAVAATAAPTTEPCSDPGRFRSPVDQSCACPPGTYVTPEKDKYDCLPGSIVGRSFYFPDCKDASGNKVPNCFMGFPLKSTLVTLGVGAVAGMLISAVLR